MGKIESSIEFLIKIMGKQIGKQEGGTSSSSHFVNGGDATILLVRELIEKQQRDDQKLALQYLCCICRISPTLVKEKPEAYIPHLVSIGPFHRNQPHLQFMESRKRCYLGKFLENQERVLDDYIKAMIELEGTARRCYQEAEKGKLEIDKKSYVMMLVVDGCFILQLLMSKDNDIMSSKKWGFLVSLDLLLLENQLPFCVLVGLYLVYNQLDEPAPISQPPDGSQALEASRRGINGLIGDSYVRRILGLLFGKDADNYSTRIAELNQSGIPKHLLDFLRRILIPKLSGQPGGVSQNPGSHVVPIRCATDLQRANVKIVKNKNPKSLLDIKFDDTTGVLKIPSLRIDCGTEMIIRNLIAYEQYTDDYSFITEYAAFLDGLIDSSKDVELLQKSGIIEIILGDPMDVSRLFNNLLKDVAVHFYYTVDIRSEVEQFCKKNRNEWMATLKLDYFNSPWTFISVVAAIILLTTAVVQTLYTILSYYHS